MTGVEGLIDGVSIPIVILDAELNVLLVNKGAKAAFSNLRTGEALEISVLGTKSLLKAVYGVLDTGRTKSVKIRNDDEFEIEFRVSIRIVQPDPARQEKHLVLTFEDRSQLRDVKTMRSDFVANVSHEIRSPLTAISGFVETLQGPARHDQEAQSLFLAMMAKEVTRMTSLVADLLSLSKVEAVEHKAPKKIVDPNLVILNALEAVEDITETKGKRLDLRIPEPLPKIAGNHDDLVRVFINLLENAVNYSRDGGLITVNGGLAPAQNALNRPAILISVEDEGEGIPIEEIPRLTERFYRVDKSRSRSVGGTGLGLAIVKHVLLRHRGKLVIDSVAGEGSTFKVFLPRPEA